MAVLLGISLVSCEEDYPKSHIAPYDTELLAIKIVNAGADGKTVVEGTIDEANKTINFPRLDVETNFSALSFEAELSEGAELQTPVMDFSMDEETSDKTLILRIVNNKRYKEYFVKVLKEFLCMGLILKSLLYIIFQEITFIVIMPMLHLPVVLLMMANMYWLSAELHNLIFLKYRI